MTTKTSKKSPWWVKALATLGALCVAGGITFTVMWCVPSIHDAVWQPQTEANGTTDTDTKTDNTTDKTDNAA